MVSPQDVDQFRATAKSAQATLDAANKKVLSDEAQVEEARAEVDAFAAVVQAVTAQIHDNHGEKDEHLLPGEGTIDWDVIFGEFAAAPEPLPLVLELKETAPGSPSLDQIRAVFDKIEKQLDEKGASSARSGPARA